jgi:DNA-binding transcriptional regulator YiaG
MQSFAKNDMRGPDRSVGGASDTEAKRFIGKDLKKIRKKYNISQRCFAEMLDISVKTLQNYEIDHRAMPSTSVSLFIFADENIDLFKKYYLSKVERLEPYRG